MKALQIFFILSTLPIFSIAFSHNRLRSDPQPSADLTVEARSKPSPFVGELTVEPSFDEVKTLSSASAKKDPPATEKRALALARAHDIQSVSELHSFYQTLNRKFIGGYPFPDQPDLRRMVDWDAILANVENENLLEFYERLLGNKKYLEEFIHRLEINN